MIEAGSDTGSRLFVYFCTMENNLISPEQLRVKLETEDLLIIDLREASSFIDGYIPGSVSAGASGKYDKWILEELKPNTVVLVTEAGEEISGLDRFSSRPLSNPTLALEGGYPAWEKAQFPIDMIIVVEPGELALDLPHDSSLQLIDLRGEEEFESAHVTKAQHIPLVELVDLATIANFDENQQIYLYCGGGQRSLLGASLLKQQGVHNLRIVTGGFDAIQQEPSIQITQKPAHS